MDGTSSQYWLPSYWLGVLKPMIVQILFILVVAGAIALYVACHSYRFRLKYADIMWDWKHPLTTPLRDRIMTRHILVLPSATSVHQRRKPRGEPALLPGAAKRHATSKRRTVTAGKMRGNQTTTTTTRQGMEEEDYNVEHRGDYQEVMPVNSGAVVTERKEHGPVIPVNEIYRFMIIGVNFSDSKNLALEGAVNDARRVCEYWHRRLKFNKSDPHKWATCTDEGIPATHRVMVKGMRWLTEGLQPNDLRFLHYSGHGVRLPSLKEVGHDEVCLLPADAEMVDVQTVSDLDIWENYVARFYKTGAYCIAMFDACYSGSQMRLMYQYQVDPDGVTIRERINKQFPELHPVMPYINAVCFGSCEPHRLAAEVVSFEPDYANRPPGQADTANEQGYGACTDGFYDFLDASHNMSNGGGAMPAAAVGANEPTVPEISWRQMMIKLTRRFKELKLNQRPQLSSSRPLDLDAPLIAFEFRD